MRKLVASALLSFLPLIAMLSWGQSANLGAIEGTITDASGAVVPGVSLSATNPATRLRFSTQSNDDGIFRFAVVPVGTYDLKAQKQGFATLVEKGIAVNVGSKVNLDLKLPVAGVSETVEVTGEPPLVETTRTKVSTTVNATAVADLPVNGRNFLDFMLLTPGVTRDVRTGDLSFAGQRGTLNSLTVDGAPAGSPSQVGQ